MNKSLVVVGGGSSAIDLAALLHEKGADVTLIVRDRQLIFHDMQPVGKRRSLWEQIRRPGSGLGPGIKSRLYCEFPHWFRFLPRELRVKIVRTHLGPSGGWFAKEKVLGRVPLLLAHTPVRVAAKGGKIHLVLRDINRKEQEMVADHVVAATGYKVDISRLTFLSGEIRSSLETLAGAPVLSQSFESSVPGLYFVGLASALSFGPLMRFAYGAEFAARHLTSALVKSVAREKALVPAAQEVSLAK